MASRYVPAAGRVGLGWLYDPVLRLTMREAVWRGAVGLSAVRGLDRRSLVVDVGAGTGAQSLVLSSLAGEGVRVLAVDGDPSALSRARAKPGADRVSWVVGRGGRVCLWRPVRPTRS